MERSGNLPTWIRLLTGLSAPAMPRAPLFPGTPWPAQDAPSIERIAEYPPPPDKIPGGPWKWSPDPRNSRGGVYSGPKAGSSASWDDIYGHWDVDDGYGNRQRYNRWGDPLTPDEAHGPYSGPRRLPLPPRVGPWILAPDPCMIDPNMFHGMCPDPGPI